MKDSNLSQPKKSRPGFSEPIPVRTMSCVLRGLLLFCAIQVLAQEGKGLGALISAAGDNGSVMRTQPPGVGGDAALPSNAPPLESSMALQDTNSQQTLKAILQLEGQIRSNQFAIEQSGKEAKELAARNAEVLSNGLLSIQSSLSVQQEGFSVWRRQEVDLLQSSNRIMLMTGGALAAIASLAMGLIAYFQWRMSKTWSNVAAVFPLRGLNGGSAVSALPVEHSSQMLTGFAAESNRRLLGTMEQLERRILQLEQLSGGALEPGALVPAAGDNGHPVEASSHKSKVVRPEPAPQGEAIRVATLLRQGKSLLKENQWEDAIARFDEVLSLKPDHGEALLKKGTALEKLQKLNEALECYDRAIATHDSMPLAYLHKGGLYNRLERFKEALECYEKALHTHDERHG